MPRTQPGTTESQSLKGEPSNKIPSREILKASLIKNDKGALGSRLSFLSECSHGLMETEYRGSLSTPQPGAPLGGRASTRAKKKKKKKKQRPQRQKTPIFKALEEKDQMKLTRIDTSSALMQRHNRWTRKLVTGASGQWSCMAEDSGQGNNSISL